MFFRLIIASLFVLAASGSVFSQVSKEPKLYVKQVLVIVSWGNERPSIGTGSFLLPQMSEFQTVLRMEDVLKEIEASQKQGKEIKNWLSRASEASLKFSALQGAGGPYDKEQFLDSHDRFHNELEEILADRQMERLAQVKNRIQLRNWQGFLGLAYQWEKFGLHLTKKEVEGIEKEASDCRTEISKVCIKKMQKTITNLYKPLRRRQKTIISQPPFDQIVPDLFLAQLRYAKGLKEKIGTTSQERLYQLEKNRPSIYGMDDGRFGSRPSGIYKDFYSRYVFEFLEKKDGGLEVSDQQRKILYEVKGIENEKVKKFRKQWHQSDGSMKASKIKNDGFAKASAELERSVKRILTTEQRKSLKLLFAKQALRKYGQVADLLVGDLGREIELTDQQRDEIREQIDIELKSWDKSLRHWEQHIVGRIRPHLSKKSKKEFNRVFGSKLTYLEPTILQLVGWQ